MNKVNKLLVASVFTLASGAVFAADQRIVTDEGIASFSFFKPASVRAEVGTTGYGGAVSWSVNPKVGVTLGYNGGDISWTDDLSINGSKYDLDMDNNNVYLNAEIRPWANWFYVAAGVAYLDNDYDISRRAGPGTDFNVDGSKFTAGATPVHLRGRLDYDNNIAPYLGIGFSPAITNRWGVFGELGAYYSGNPTVRLGANAAALGLVSEDGRLLGEALAGEANDLRVDNKYEWLPVAKLGLSFRF